MDIPIPHHARRELRNEVEGYLRAYGFGFTANDNVVYPSSVDEVAISTPEEDVLSRFGTGSMGEITTRRLVFEIQCRVKATEALSALQKGDEFARKVETILGTRTTIGGRARELRLESTESELSFELEKPAALVTLRYGVLYAFDPRDFIEYAEVGA